MTGFADSWIEHTSGLGDIGSVAITSGAR